MDDTYLQSKTPEILFQLKHPMILFYNAGIWLYQMFITIASLFNEKARYWVKGRKNIFKYLKAAINGNEKIAWFHCASLGEFEQGRPVIEEFRKKYSNYKILLTFFSPSGYEIRKNYQFADYIFYLPIDTKKNATTFIKIVNPAVVFFVKYEFWYNYLSVLINNKIPVIVFSAIFRQNQYFFKWYAGWYRKTLRKIRLFTVQNLESTELLKSIGIENYILSGDTRFDRVCQIKEKTKSYPLIEKFKDNSMVLVSGSTWSKDEEIICNYINENSQSIKFIIAPHVVSEEKITSIEKKLKVSHVKFSALTSENAEKSNVIIVDGIGFLSNLYAYGNLAYIGGGFNSGIHNILEPAVFGLPVIFGPNFHKFQEAKDLINKGAAFSIQNQEDFTEIINTLINDNTKLMSCSEISKNYVYSKTGASEIILAKIKNNFVD
jgi:3-deoxy-D-manno-octulosonic-acid transferase